MLSPRQITRNECTPVWWRLHRGSGPPFIAVGRRRSHHSLALSSQCPRNAIEVLSAAFIPPRYSLLCTQSAPHPYPATTVCPCSAQAPPHPPSTQGQRSPMHAPSPAIHRPSFAAPTPSVATSSAGACPCTYTGSDVWRGRGEQEERGMTSI